MQKIIVSLMFLLVFAFPVAAQTSLGESYTTDVGTTIDYPIGWTLELEDNLVVLTQGSSSRIVMLDYPLVSLLANNRTVPLDSLVEIVANEVIGSAIDSDRILFDTVFNRELARYDIPTRGSNASSAVVAVKFSNNRIGMLVSINVRETTFQSVLSTFDNINPTSDDIILQTRIAQSAEAFIFPSGGRFSYPAGWSYTPQRRSGIEYVTLSAPDNGAAMILFDTSERVGESVALDDVLETANLRLAQQFAITLDDTTARTTAIGSREGLRYDATVSQRGETYDAEVTILRYSDNGVGIFVAYGNLAAYAPDINLVLSSFNNLGAILNFVN